MRARYLPAQLVSRGHFFPANFKEVRKVIYGVPFLTLSKDDGC